ncbi:unnamed protein product [Mytilus edulis]|uniref:DDE Tnp4 domain-containing protein n=1 Tax=Mytilus edulis TaxID=6550 RepID=A0A8S3VEG7_MYTED|nr:unnamed protein product [Mytilus edulis]
MEASSTVSTHYLESDFLPQKDHTYRKERTDFQTKSSQTNIVLTEEKGVQSKSDGATMSAAQNLKTDNDALLYTGVTKEVFFTLVKCFTPFNTFSFQLEVADQLLLVLMRLKLNLIFDDLCRRFGISSGLACKIFNSWIPVLADKLKSLIVWLPREVIRDCCPESFRENYPRTTCIIDCAETFIQRPTNLRSRGETYSNYKSHNTAKYLVGISPHGQIMFISKAFGGRASDKFIVEKSGFMNYLLPGDEIMADRGFTIDDLLFPLRVKLNIPAFTKNKPQLSAEDVTTTRRKLTQITLGDDGALTWGSVFETFRDGLDNIKLVIDALLSLPPTSVNNETTFSRTKLSKGKRRGHLKTDTLKDLIQVEIETANVEQFDPKLDDRRRRVGYSRPSRLTETLQTNTVDQETVVVGHDEIDTPAAGQDIQIFTVGFAQIKFPSESNVFIEISSELSPIDHLE